MAMNAAYWHSSCLGPLARGRRLPDRRWEAADPPRELAPGMDLEVYWKAVEFIDALDRRYADNQAVGWVYAVRNTEFRRPLIKIGMSSNPPHVRAIRLASTGVPGVFELIYCVHAVNARLAESMAHEALASYRLQPDKEFFEAPIGEVVRILDAVGAQLPIRRSQARSGRYNERSKPLDQPFGPRLMRCKTCGTTNRVRPLAIPVNPVCGKCSGSFPPLPGIQGSA